jgi:hypothetical protein
MMLTLSIRAAQERDQLLVREEQALARSEAELMAAEAAFREQARKAQMALAEARRQTQPPPYWRLQNLVAGACNMVDITAEFKDKARHLA